MPDVASVPEVRLTEVAPVTEAFVPEASTVYAAAVVTVKTALFAVTLV